MVKFMTRGQRGVVLRIERTSIHDGVGLRTVVFLKGCPLSCIWCSTPESQNSFHERGYISSRCRGCGACVEVCPADALALQADQVIHNTNLCQHCLACVDICVADAVTSFGRWMHISEVMAEIAKDEVFYFHSGGGVTISGGECLQQSDFTAEILRRCARLGIDSTVETSLHTPWKNVEKIVSHLSCIYIDLKHPDPHKHKYLVGVDNHLILTNLEKLNNLEQPLEIQLRIPLIPGINDSDDSMQQAAEIANRLNKVSRIEILPYHRLGVTTYDTLQRGYALPDMQTPNAEYVEEKRVVLQKFLKNVEAISSR